MLNDLNYLSKEAAENWLVLIVFLVYAVLNTVFMITADYVLGHFQERSLGKFRIPLIVYRTRNHIPLFSRAYVSQQDHFLSIVSLLNRKGKYNAIGGNLFVCR